MSIIQRGSTSILSCWNGVCSCCCSAAVCRGCSCIITMLGVSWVGILNLSRRIWLTFRWEIMMGIRMCRCIYSAAWRRCRLLLLCFSTFNGEWLQIKSWNNILMTLRSWNRRDMLWRSAESSIPTTLGLSLKDSKITLRNSGTMFTNAKLS